MDGHSFHLNVWQLIGTPPAHEPQENRTILLWLFIRGSAIFCSTSTTWLKFYFQLGRDLRKVGLFRAVFAKFQVA